jgi:hypothetical protein
MEAQSGGETGNARTNDNDFHPNILIEIGMTRERGARNASSHPGYDAARST